MFAENGSAYDPNNTIPTVKFRDGSIMVWGCIVFSLNCQNPNYQREDEWSHVPGNPLEEFFAVHQDDEDEIRVDLPAGQRSKIYCKGAANWFQRKKINVLEWSSQSPD